MFNCVHETPITNQIVTENPAKQFSVFSQSSNWLKWRDCWETPERHLRDTWETPERHLRDSCEDSLKIWARIIKFELRIHEWNRHTHTHTHTDRVSQKTIVWGDIMANLSTDKQQFAILFYCLDDTSSPPLVCPRLCPSVMMVSWSRAGATWNLLLLFSVLFYLLSLF